MQMWYGGTSLPVNGASSTVGYRLIMSDTGRPLRYVGDLEVVAYLDGSGQADLTAKELAFNAAALVPYQDLVLKQDSGAPSGTRLINSSSLSGVRIIDGPRYTNESKDGEYTVQRVCRFTAQASFLIPNAANAVMEFHESVTILGTNDPKTVWRHFVNFGPIQQEVYPSTTTRVIQAGSCIGHTGPPFVPPPLWPWPIEQTDRRRITRSSPKREGPNALIEFPASWSYEFESDLPLVAFPSVPPL